MSKKIFFFLLILLTISVACKDDIDDEKKLNAYVNEWLYVNMDAYYYWKTELPVYKKSYESPEEYFETLLYKDDRFSAFYDNYNELINRLNGVTASEVGFEFKLFQASTTNNLVIAIVSYTKPGTNAQQLGIKRGDIINRINGTQMTMDNYQQLLSSLADATASVKLGFATLVASVYTDSNELTVNKSTNYTENPILMDTVYHQAGKKIAYLVYNFFTADQGDKSQRYDLELNTVMERFNTENINDIIIDLRYNSGGMMTSAIRLGSMLVPGLTNEKVFSYTEYNDYLTKYFNSDEYKKKYSDNPFVEYFTTGIVVNSQNRPVQNISSRINRVFFITGKSTASASEMVINGLKPYLPCILIGEVTVGKNVGSIVINDDNNAKNKNAFMPIILKYFNKDRQSDFTFGFVPDFQIRDDFNYQLGDTREALLAKAIYQITGMMAVTPAAERPAYHERQIPVPFGKPSLLIKDGIPKSLD